MLWSVLKGKCRDLWVAGPMGGAFPYPRPRPPKPGRPPLPQPIPGLSLPPFQAFPLPQAYPYSLPPSPALPLTASDPACKAIHFALARRHPRCTASSHCSGVYLYEDTRRHTHTASLYGTLPNSYTPQYRIKPRRCLDTRRGRVK